MKGKEAYKIFSQAITALNSLRTLLRAAGAIKKLVGTQTEQEENVDFKKVELKANQLRGALLNLDFKKADVDRTIKKLTGRIRSEELPELLKEALKELNKG